MILINASNVLNWVIKNVLIKKEVVLCVKLRIWLKIKENLNSIFRALNYRRKQSINRALEKSIKYLKESNKITTRIITLIIKINSLICLSSWNKKIRLELMSRNRDKRSDRTFLRLLWIKFSLLILINIRIFMIFLFNSSLSE